MKFGSVTVEGRVALAPMAGVADRAMRELCRGYGAALVVGELCSSRGICLKDKKSAELLFVSDAERPMGVQLFGNDPDIMARAAEFALTYSPDFIDINMGCPAPKVAMNGGGSALMKDPLLAADIVAAVRRAVPIPVTVKIRSGWDETSKNAVEVAQRCEAAGADLVTVHGRTRAQGYAPPADWAIIGAVKKAVSIPVIGNGDVTSPVLAARLLEETGCDMVMVGRAAQGAPWIFSQINAYLDHGVCLPAPPVAERMRILLRQVEKMIAYKGEHIALLEARKHAAWYMKGIRGAASFRRACGQIDSFEALACLAAQVLERAAALEDSQA